MNAPTATATVMIGIPAWELSLGTNMRPSQVPTFYGMLPPFPVSEKVVVLVCTCETKKTEVYFRYPVREKSSATFHELFFLVEVMKHSNSTRYETRFYGTYPIQCVLHTQPHNILFPGLKWRVVVAAISSIIAHSEEVVPQEV